MLKTWLLNSSQRVQNSRNLNHLVILYVVGHWEHANKTLHSKPGEHGEYDVRNEPSEPWLLSLGNLVKDRQHADAWILTFTPTHCFLYIKTTISAHSARNGASQSTYRVPTTLADDLSFSFSIFNLCRNYQNIHNFSTNINQQKNWASIKTKRLEPLKTLSWRFSKFRIDPIQIGSWSDSDHSIPWILQIWSVFRLGSQSVLQDLH